jgi:hypothetical protein
MAAHLWSGGARRSITERGGAVNLPSGRPDGEHPAQRASPAIQGLKCHPDMDRFSSLA